MTVFALQPVHYPQILDGMVEGVRSAVVQVLLLVQLRRTPRHFEAVADDYDRDLCKTQHLHSKTWHCSSTLELRIIIYQSDNQFIYQIYLLF